MDKTTESLDGKPAVYVYEAPVRIWHWVNAFAIVILCISGYLIGSPPPSLSGEASSHFQMGYIRFAHFATAYIMIITFLMRIYWAAVGNDNARELFFPPLFKAQFWDGVWHEIKWYLFIAKEPRKYIGHNPLAVLFMHFMYLWVSIFMIFTGLALYGEGTGAQSWQHTLFSSWLIPLFGQSQDVHTWHHFAMWILISFIIIHIYVAIREDIMSRQTMVSTMVSGWRTFKDNRSTDND